MDESEFLPYDNPVKAGIFRQDAASVGVPFRVRYVPL